MNKIYPYAGFWKRALALLIDSIVLSALMGIVYAIILIPQGVAFVKLASSGADPSPDMMMGIMGRYFASMALVWIITIVSGWLYFALMESGTHQATLGKRALGIKVTGSHGERISFARATGRFFGKMISGMTLYFGFYMAGFTQKRQALHDILANTFVIVKEHTEEDKELTTLPFSKGGCAASIIVTIAPVILYFAMIILVIMTGIASGIDGDGQNAAQRQPAAITQQVQP